MQHNSPPQSLAQLRSRADELAHRTVGELASILQMPLPDKLNHHKGLIGQMLEAILGTDAGNESLPDFTKLGIELKTLPVGPTGQPKESTYVCTVPLGQIQSLTWDNSAVKAKLSHVLWIPILVLPNSPLSARQILPPVFWQPTPTESEILETDFNELIDLIALGDLSQITASLGTYLHIRPKAANASCLTSYEDEKTLPRGFYLRSGLTKQLVKSSNFV
jgi:DNA mismatch repair protein MutH